MFTYRTRNFSYKFFLLKNKYIITLSLIDFSNKYFFICNIFDNILERMRCKKEVISCIYQDIQGRWYITYIVPAQYHENGDVRTVLIASRDIDKHQKNEPRYPYPDQWNSWNGNTCKTSSW